MYESLVDRLRIDLRADYWRLRRHEDWNVGVVKAPVERFLEPEYRPDVEWFPPHRSGTYRADPFIIERDGRTFVFFEEFDWRPARGVLACVELVEGVPVMPSRLVIGSATHTSYPYVFEDRGEAYCVPETAETHEVALYHATDFPFDWTKVAVLIEGVPALDSTVFRHGHRWWLACTSSSDGPDSKLRLWHAPELLGPWEPHAGNPVKTDRKSSRPAGRPWVHVGQLYRPAQDCSSTYGGGVVLNRVSRLTPDEFREEPAAVIPPLRDSPYPSGLHTLSASDGITVLDAKRMVFTPSALPHVMRYTLYDVWGPRLQWFLRARRG